MHGKTQREMELIGSTTTSLCLWGSKEISSTLKPVIVPSSISFTTAHIIQKMDQKAQYTVLRIKRKATEAPLSSLGTANFAKRLETRLTSLVIQDPSAGPGGRATKRRDVSNRPRGIFRLAETVPPTWQGQGDEGEALKTRIRGLMETMDMEEEEEGMNDPGPSRPPVGGVNDPSPSPATRGHGVNSPVNSTTQYRVIPPISPRSRMMLPPKVLSHRA
jgi:hypothetical protein